MLWNGLGGFRQTEVRLSVDLPAARLPVAPAQLRGRDAPDRLAGVDLEQPLADAAASTFGADARRLVSDAAWLRLRDAILADPQVLTRRIDLWVPAPAGLDAPTYRRLADADLARSRFDWTFLNGADATTAEAAGIWGALKGSLLTMLVTFACAVPVGVLAALYLEEYAPRTRWTDLIEVSINNLAAVPSIIFGLLGLALFLNLMHLPRSAPLVGGLTLALMTMPVIVIVSRGAIRSVPPSVRDAARGIGASRTQVTFHHVLPLALPGILTGTIIGMARAAGETAPLLMIGMRAFVATPPGGLLDPATVLPVQVFLWSDAVSRGYVETTSAAILVLMAALLAMNGAAIALRNRLERRR